MAGSFTQKLLSFNFGSITLPAGSRASVHLKYSAAPAPIAAEGVVFGLTLQQMNALTILNGKTVNSPGKAPISIQAGDSNGLSLAFSGNMMSAFMDGRGMPEVGFRFTAITSGAAATQNIEPTSTQGTTDVATTAQQLAQKAGFAFENNGVSKKLSNHYLSGSVLTQIDDLLGSAGVAWCIENGTLAIWNPSVGRTTASKGVVLSKSTGMIGYPACSNALLYVDCLFNPAIKTGAVVTVKSDITPANGSWQVIAMEATLESLMPHGRWDQTLTLAAIGDGAKQDAGDEGGF